MPFDSLAQDVRVAARALLRSPGFVAVALLSLAAGIGLNTAVFTVVNSIFLQTIRGVPEREAVAFVGGRMSWAGFDRLRADARTFAGLTAWQPMSVDVSLGGGEAERRTAPLVASDYFAVLRVPAIAGRTFAPVAGSRPEADAVAVLDHQFWQQRFGGRADAVGRTIVVNRVPVTIIGVAPREFHGPGPERPPFWLPAGLLPQLARRPVDWGDSLPRDWRAIGRLREGATLDGAAAELRTLVARAPALYAAGRPTLAIGREPWEGPESPEKHVEFLLVVAVPLVVVGVILWIGCSNVANLLLARAVARRKEIVIRLATGASRWRVVRMLLVESLLLALGGGVLGLLVGRWTLVWLWAAIPEVGNIAVDLDGRVLAYTLAVSVCSVLLFGLAPALQATRVDVAPALQGGMGRGGTLHASRLRAFFLVTQIASSVVLLVVAATFVRTLLVMRFGERAEAADRTVTAWVPSGAATPAARAEFWRQARERVGAIPGVRGVALQAGSESRVRLLPAERTAADTARGAAPPDVAYVAADSADPRLSATHLLAGRAMTPADRAGDAPGIVVNLELARRTWGGAREAIGQRATIEGLQTATVVGVVRDFAGHARAYRLLADAEVRDATLVVSATVPATSLVVPLRRTLRAMTPDPALVRVQTLRDAQLGSMRRVTLVAVAIGFVALLLATIGLYGSISFHVGQRTREIAIRVAVGAPQQRLLRLLLGHGARLVALGCALGSVLGWVAFRFMAGLVFGGWSLDVVTLGAVMLVFAATTLLASWLPGRRAMRVDPISVLRSE